MMLQMAGTVVCCSLVLSANIGDKFSLFITVSTVKSGSLHIHDTGSLPIRWYRQREGEVLFYRPVYWFILFIVIVMILLLPSRAVI
jgi:hypothetical protein